MLYLGLVKWASNTKIMIKIRNIRTCEKYFWLRKIQTCESPACLVSVLKMCFEQLCVQAYETPKDVLFILLYTLLFLVNLLCERWYRLSCNGGTRQFLEEDGRFNSGACRYCKLGKSTHQGQWCGSALPSPLYFPFLPWHRY